MGRIAAVLCLSCCCASAAAQPTCLRTSYESDNQWAGNMFDIEPLRDIDITRWQVNTTGTEMVTVEVYWREGSYEGFENDPSAWTLLGTATTQGQGRDYPTSINVGLLPVYAGHTYGIYVNLASYRIGEQALRWVRGEPTVFENSDLKLTTGVGMRDPAFAGTPYENEMWSGRVCYEDPRPLVSVDGECPGRVSVSWDRTAPNAVGAVCFARNLGRFVIPNPCTGTVLELGADHLRLVRTFRTGPAGRGRIYERATTEFCGGYVQLVIVGNPCETSNVAQVPG